jgi:two-component system CheB/CheR fusion protein
MTNTAGPSYAVKRRLLLIDDAPDNLEVLTVLLGDQYDVFSYGSCREALLDLPDIKPDLLLLDVRMFPINGVDFLSEVRAMRGFCGIPAIAVTALAGDAEKEAFLAAGFQEIVTKPILDLATLEATIAQLLKTTAAA